MILHSHKEITDSFNLISIANNFVANSKHRLSIFGRFDENDQTTMRNCIQI